MPLGEGIQTCLGLGRVHAISLAIVTCVSADLVVAGGFVNGGAVFKANLATQGFGIICAKVRVLFDPG